MTGAQDQIALDTPLPVLRPDIEIHSGPPGADGSPTYTVHDPVNRTFDKIGWAEAVVLQKLRGQTSLAQVMEHLARHTTLHLSPQEILVFCQEAAAKGLTMHRATRPVAELLGEHQKNKTHPLRWLLHHYLYFRVPLVHPDKFLGRTLHLVKPLTSVKALAVYLMAATTGLVMCAERMDEYLGTFPYFFNWQGMAVFGLVVAVIKTIHELSHAYTAKAHGLRVPAMGVAFIVMWPVAYCDVTDAWKIDDRRKRLAISSAGIKVELVIAGLALLAWGLTGPGLAHGIFFVISSSSLLSTLLVNTNPAMRFDGYFLLMDIWGIDNLQPRAFALTRWAYRKWFLGLQEPNPDPEITGGRFWGVIAYSAYTWIYRLTLYAAIAVLVYHKFIKLLGIFLFMVEIWWFILGPFISEAKMLMARRRLLTANRRILATGLAVALILLWYALPLPHEIYAPAVVTAASNQVIYAPFSGDIQEISSSRGALVQKGMSLSLIQSDKIDTDIKVLELEKQLSLKKLELYGLDESERAYIPQQEEEITDVSARLAALYSQREQSRQVAELTGILYEWDENLHDGMAVSHQQVLGKIADFNDLVVYAFVNEDWVMDLVPGAKAVFISDADPEPLEAIIVSIQPVRTEHMQYLALTSAAKGSLPVIKENKGKLTMVESYYTVEAKVLGQPRGLPLGQSGHAWMSAKPRSRLMDGLRRTYRVLVREISF